MKVPGQGANEKASGAGALGDDPSLRKFLRLAGLGLAWLILMAFPDVANSRPPSLPKSCYEVLREHPEIPETEYIVIVRDNARDYRLRECAGQDYAIRHPESVKEFIKLLFEHPDTVRIAIDSLRDMGPSARPAVPFLISLLESDQKIYYHSISLKNALASIGVVDRESIDRLLDMAITKRPNPFIAGLAAQILSSQKTLPAYVGDVVTAALEKNGDGSREYLGSLYQILIPVRIPQAVERRVERAKAGVLHDGRVFNKIGAAAILALIDNSREHVDLESRVFSIIALMKMKTAESVQAGKRLAQEMLPLLEQSAETQMRLTLIQTLKDIKYTDALPTMRRLADGDHDAEVRSAAAKYVEALKGVELCREALGAFPEISEAEYLDIAKDKSRHYRLRVCAGEWYAARHPEWLGKFIELLFDHEAHLNTPLFAIQRLERMGPGARSAVPFLISALDRARNDKYADDLSGALISIGVVERESIDQLLDMAITKRVWRYVCLKAEQVLASQKTLPAHVGDVVIA
ncbi:MAG: HEAT repeat domain-containing protein, partial [Candidatus Accumulibacter sp.]|nr:HEAT repeat domain-containing protein [Accumulibacter sp.]